MYVISLYRMTYAIAAGCSERLPFSVYLLFGKYLIQHNKVYNVCSVQCIGCSSNLNVTQLNYVEVYFNKVNVQRKVNFVVVWLYRFFVQGIVTM